MEYQSKKRRALSQSNLHHLLKKSNNYWSSLYINPIAGLRYVRIVVYCIDCLFLTLLSKPDERINEKAPNRINTLATRYCRFYHKSLLISTLDFGNACGPSLSRCKHFHFSFQSPVYLGERDCCLCRIWMFFDTQMCARCSLYSFIRHKGTT